ncbi:TrkH family potassium uptake protein [Petrocella sp. FN5]|uniref:TrkH family potassium uptake protein n=1 Tax=Petrocella sp. FN5 TaxID=3032002 RepID=UPI0023DA0209|nr:TrkH family potassium uptake protein [Petrocella sp. FN5]MDF1615942.1 TrkH family potassium uptake protein [Petrocella sp. FN5]
MAKQKNQLDVNLKPTQVLVLGFLVVIIVGAILLSLPISSNSGKSTGFIDALFTSTSAVCVTGLVVVNTSLHWSAFGKVVILMLIQVGGLGFMTIASTIFMILGRKISLRDRMMIQESLNQNTLSGMVRLTKNIIIGTLIIEAIGALFLSLKFVPEYGAKGIFYSIFHAISAFCNAGFDIIGDNSLTPYVGSVIINFTVMALIIIGGLGFTVWMDVLKVTKKELRFGFKIKRWFRQLRLHTKLVLVISTSLIVVGFLFFFFLEGFNDATLGNLPLKDKLLGAMFQSVTTRTAGFNTITNSDMTDVSKFITILLMFIGGSPAGTAGGIKTVTIGVIFFEVLSVVRGKDDAEAFNRRIPRNTIKRALAVVMISLSVVMGVTMLLTITESGGFMDILFEAVSGFATVGLSLGETSKLSQIGKLIMSMTMFIGRLGPITMAVALTIRHEKKKINIRKPEEKVMVG